MSDVRDVYVVQSAPARVNRLAFHRVNYTSPEAAMRIRRLSN